MKTISLFATFAIMSSITANCKDPVESPQAPAESPQVIPGKPEEYFPTEIGRKFDYKIELTDSEKPAMNHDQIRWSSNVRLETRGRYLVHEKKDDLHLTIKIKSKALKQGILKCPQGYELEIERDDIGVFEDCQKVFWAITNSDRYEALLVTEHNLKNPNVPDNQEASTTELGCNLRFAFFGGKKSMMSIGLNKENDSLTFVGPTEHKGRPALKFIRGVTAREVREGESTILDHGFDEEMIFVLGVGMVQLIQTVDKTVTMKWTLIE